MNMGVEEAGQLIGLLTDARQNWIYEDDLPGGIDEWMPAIDALREVGHDIRLPIGQRNLSLEYPGECKGRVIRLVKSAN